MTRFKQQDQHSLVNILLRYWEEIIAMEQEFSLLVGQGDTRPRIEFFHDAIRAFTAPHKTAAQTARLSVEALAYDVRWLRYIATMPLASITSDAQNLSPSTSLVVSGQGLVPTQKRMERGQKERLQELYGQYGVLFSALLRATADADYHERTEENNQQVSDMNQIIAAIEKQASVREIESMLHHLDDGELRQKLAAMLSKPKNEVAAKGAVAMLKSDIQRLDKNWRTADAAYHAYATSQLAIYEASKDMLKQMAGQGMNLVGQFVESALRGGGQGRGR